MDGAPRLGVRYRLGLRKAVGASAGPYGYTLTIWTSGAVLIHNRGVPDTLEAILFAFGAVLGFALVGALAFRRTVVVRIRATSHPVLWGSFHFIPVAASIGAAGLVAHFVEGTAAFPLAGFLATSIYLLCVAAQITFFEEQVFEDLEAEAMTVERQLIDEL